MYKLNPQPVTFHKLFNKICYFATYISIMTIMSLNLTCMHSFIQFWRTIKLTLSTICQEDIISLLWPGKCSFLWDIFNISLQDWLFFLQLFYSLKRYSIPWKAKEDISDDNCLCWLQPYFVLLCWQLIGLLRCSDTIKSSKLQHSETMRSFWRCTMTWEK